MFLRTKINRYESRPKLEGRDQAHAPKRTYAFGLNWEPRSDIYLSFDMTGKSSYYYTDSHANKFTYSIKSLSDFRCNVLEKRFDGML